MGEFDFDSNFLEEEGESPGGPGESYLTAQFFFVLFYLLVSIVLSNLIVGMTVSKTEELFKQATEIKLSAIAWEIIGIEKICLRKNKKLFACLYRWFAKKTQLFSFLDGAVVCVVPNKNQYDSNRRRGVREVRYLLIKLYHSFCLSVCMHTWQRKDQARKELSDVFVHSLLF